MKSGPDSGKKKSAGGLRQGAEYALLRVVVAAIGVLPRRLARGVGAALADGARVLLKRLRETGCANLKLAYPESSEQERETILRGVYRSLGWQMAEFCCMPRYTAESTRGFVRAEGMEHFLAAKARGRGVLIVTGHLGAWELSSFYHSLMGHPMSMVIRRLDNPRVDAWVNRVRCLHGNRVIHKDDFARGLLQAMHDGETVGILMDTNMTPPQGVFVPFFGVPACTASGLAKVAMKSGAAVLPGFMVWEESERMYVLRFGAELEVQRTGDDATDVVANTARFTQAIEACVRRNPEQWLWLHRRWKTRPAGEERLYP